MDKPNNENTKPSNCTSAYEDTGEPSNNTSTTIVGTEENVANVSATPLHANANATTDDVTAANLLLALHKGNNFTPRQGTITSCSSTLPPNPTTPNEDTGLDRLLSALQHGINITPHQGAITGRGSTQPTVQDDLMDTGEPIASSSHYQVASNSGNGKAPIKLRGLFICERCDMRFCTLALSRTHSRCIPRRYPRFVCEFCREAFMTGPTLLDHKKYAHSGDQKELCDICGARFGLRKALSTHRRQQHPNLFKTCMVCKTVFKTVRAWDNHRRTPHKEYAKLSCDVCSVKFVRRRSLNFHREQQHNGGPRNGALKVRSVVSKKAPVRRTHHKSTECALSSKYKTNVKCHYARVHSDVVHKPGSKFNIPGLQQGYSYVCSYGCGYRSRMYTTMICHQRTCTKARRYR